jgi:hypothetical protein
VLSEIELLFQEFFLDIQNLIEKNYEGIVNILKHEEKNAIVSLCRPLLSSLQIEDRFAGLSEIDEEIAIIQWFVEYAVNRIHLVILLDNTSANFGAVLVQYPFLRSKLEAVHIEPLDQENSKCMLANKMKWNEHLFSQLAAIFPYGSSENISSAAIKMYECVTSNAGLDANGSKEDDSASVSSFVYFLDMFAKVYGSKFDSSSFEINRCVLIFIK